MYRAVKAELMHTLRRRNTTTSPFCFEGTGECPRPGRVIPGLTRNPSPSVGGVRPRAPRTHPCPGRVIPALTRNPSPSVRGVRPRAPRTHPRRILDAARQLRGDPSREGLGYVGLAAVVGRSVLRLDIYTLTHDPSPSRGRGEQIRSGNIVQVIDGARCTSSCTANTPPPQT